MTFTIRPLEPRDREAWDPLWAAYLVFYDTVLEPAVTEMVWTRLADDRQPVHAFGAFASSDPSSLVGFAHYLFHPATWTLTTYCYLEDLFTAPEARGQGVGRALVAATEAAARAAGSSKLYWHTDTTNATARALYDQVARHDGVIVYERDLT
ncbi:MAG: family acetyltransferase [Acidimicrobiales bacterium]|nr:family acetyltransferase [Acidimicrobiales bacterium]